jgi:hypothetical protein
VPELPILGSYKVVMSPPSRPPLHLQSPASPPSLAPKSPHYPEAIATTDLSFPSLPTHQRPLEWVPRISLLVARPDEPQCRLDRTSMRSCALPQPLVHGKPPHVQSTELWTRSTPIFVRKINTSKPVSHHFSERPSSFLKINPRHLIS